MILNSYTTMTMVKNRHVTAKLCLRKLYVYMSFSNNKRESQLEWSELRRVYQILIYNTSRTHRRGQGVRWLCGFKFWVFWCGGNSGSKGKGTGKRMQLASYTFVPISLARVPLCVNCWNMFGIKTELTIPTLLIHVGLHIWICFFGLLLPSQHLNSHSLLFNRHDSESLYQS